MYWKSHFHGELVNDIRQELFVMKDLGLWQLENESNLQYARRLCREINALARGETLE